MLNDTDVVELSWIAIKHFPNKIVFNHVNLRLDAFGQGCYNAQVGFGLT